MYVLANNYLPAQPMERLSVLSYISKVSTNFQTNFSSKIDIRFGGCIHEGVIIIYLFVYYIHSLFIYLFIFYLYSTEFPILHFLAFWLVKYRQVSNIRRTKSQHFKDSRTVLRLSLPNPLKPDVKSRMKM